MPWEYINQKQLFRDKAGWQKAKGVLAKITVGRTDLSAKMNEIDAEWKKLDANKFMRHMVTKDPKTDLDSALTEIRKMWNISPKIRELSELAKKVKAEYGSKLPGSAKTFLDGVVKDCEKFPQLVRFSEDDERKQYKEFHQVV